MAPPRIFKSNSAAAPREKRRWWPMALFWLFVVLGIGGIVLMVVKAPREKNLICNENAPHSLWSFGTCVVDEN